jgi:hypothetical protein
MQLSSPLHVKWHRLALAMLVTLVVADTAPHPDLSPGLLQTLAGRVQTHLDQHP